MKNIIIYTTNDEIVSLHLVNKIVSLERYKDCNIDIFLSKPNFIRKLKVLLVKYFLPLHFHSQFMVYGSLVIAQA